MKTFKEMDDAEFSKAQRNAENALLSPFAKFCKDCNGYRFMNLKGNDLDKWEVWEKGFNNIEKILKDNRIVVIKKSNNHEVIYK